MRVSPASSLATAVQGISSQRVSVCIPGIPCTVVSTKNSSEFSGAAIQMPTCIYWVRRGLGEAVMKRATYAVRILVTLTLARGGVISRESGCSKTNVWFVRETEILDFFYIGKSFQFLKNVSTESCCQNGRMLSAAFPLPNEVTI